MQTDKDTIRIQSFVTKVANKRWNTKQSKHFSAQSFTVDCDSLKSEIFRIYVSDINGTKWITLVYLIFTAFKPSLKIAFLKRDQFFIKNIVINCDFFAFKWPNI